MYAEETRTAGAANHRDDMDGAYSLNSGPAIEVSEMLHRPNSRDSWLIW